MDANKFTTKMCAGTIASSGITAFDRLRNNACKLASDADVGDCHQTAPKAPTHALIDLQCNIKMILSCQSYGNLIVINGNWLGDLFRSIDNKDAVTFLGFLTDDVFFRFGNAEPVHGKTNVGNVIKGFFESVKGLQHDLIQSWSQDDTTICHGFVTYTRHDGTTLTVPFSNIFKLEEQVINEYLVFVDISQLYNHD